jgi:hypothetical protein
MSEREPNEAPCPACAAAAAPTSYVYAIGKVEARFPRLSVEKEFVQTLGRAHTAGQTDQQAFYNALSQRENRYLARQLCWVMTIQAMDSYILHPRDPADFDLLVGAIRPVRSPMDIDVVIGVRGPMSPPELCNGLTAPIVAFDQIYSFDRASLIASIPSPRAEDDEAERLRPAAAEVFDMIMQMTDNTGARDEHRALNYLAMRYPAIYATAAEQFAKNFSLTSVQTRLSSLSAARRIVDVIFSYTNRNTDFTEQFVVRVDVTEEFPFLASKLSPYYFR